jgi:hypothetical protein
VEFEESEWAVEVLPARNAALVPILGMGSRLLGRRYRSFASIVRRLIQFEVGRIYSLGAVALTSVSAWLFTFYSACRFDLCRFSGVEFLLQKPTGIFAKGDHAWRLMT